MLGRREEIGAWSSQVRGETGRNTVLEAWGVTRGTARRAGEVTDHKES